MESHETLWPKDVWAAIKITAEREHISISEVIRTGTTAYVSFTAARRNDDASEALGVLFDDARAAVKAWPLGEDEPSTSG